MPKLPVFPPLAKLVFDVAAGTAVALLALLLGRRLPGDDIWNYMSGLLFLAGIVLPIVGAYLILWSVEKLGYDPRAIRQQTDVSIVSVFGVIVWWLAVMVIGALAILALFIRGTTNLVTGFMHVVGLPMAAHVPQLVAERSGLAGLIVIILVTEFAWNRPEWIRLVVVRVRSLGESHHAPAEYAEGDGSAMHHPTHRADSVGTEELPPFVEQALAHGD